MKTRTSLAALAAASLLVPTALPAAVVFSDDFSTSTVGSLTPSAPTPTSTSYQLISSKTWVPTPAIGLNDFKYGIAATTSGHVEAQALFSTTPVALGTVGDYVELIVVFANTAGLFTQSGQLGFGLYNSGGIGPIPGGMNATAVSGTLGVTGGAQGWTGYDTRVAFTGGSSRIAVRPAQAITTGNNQDLVTEGSGSQSYTGNVNLNTVASTLSIAAASTLTEAFRITLTAAGIYQIDSTLYSGAGTGGSTLYTQTAAGVTGANFFNGFDGLAIGWRATANASATTIDIASIAVNAQVGAVPEPGIGALVLTGLAVLGMRFRRQR